MNSDIDSLLRLLEARWPGLDPALHPAVGEFYRRMLAENAVQNLTRLTSPEDFFEGHVLDVRELLKSGLLGPLAMDLGSGGGVPGLLAGLIAPSQWILAESEGRKAEFLARTVLEMRIPHVSVFSGRAEAYLKRKSVECVVARAVGPVDRIFGWIGNCSTWNRLVLFKGPRWEDEWKEFKAGSHKDYLEIEQVHTYKTTSEDRTRVIVSLVRVPRGTIRQASDRN